MDETESIVAAGISLPDVDTLEDLPDAVVWAQEHPESRWWVRRRALTLGAEEPEWEEAAETAEPEGDPDAGIPVYGPGGVQAAAARYICAASVGQADKAAL